MNVLNQIAAAVLRQAGLSDALIAGIAAAIVEAFERVVKGEPVEKVLGSIRYCAEPDEAALRQELERKLLS